MATLGLLAHTSQHQVYSTATHLTRGYRVGDSEIAGTTLGADLPGIVIEGTAHGVDPPVSVRPLGAPAKMDGCDVHAQTATHWQVNTGVTSFLPEGAHITPLNHVTLSTLTLPESRAKPDR